MFWSQAGARKNLLFAKLGYLSRWGVRWADMKIGASLLILPDEGSDEAVRLNCRLPPTNQLTDLTVEGKGKSDM